MSELQSRISELGLDLPVAENASALLEPFDLNGFRLANRMVVLPMEGCDGLADGSPDELTFRRYRRFASGGAGLLWFEATAVVEEGRANPRQLWIRKETLPGFAKLVEQSRKAAPHPVYCVLQLTHSGRYSKPGRYPKPIIAHRSPYLDPLHKLPDDYPIISDEELERLEDIYVEAARLAHEAGFDAVDVKACHRYLVSELHASHTRDGRYGGPFENRTRFFRNVVAKIRSAVPGITVTSRMNAYDAMAYPYGFGVDREDPAKPDLTEPIELVRFLKENGAPLVNITIGNPYYNPHVNRPFDLPVAGAPVPKESPLYGVARFVQIVRRIQEEFPGMAVIGGGYSWLRHYFPNVAAAAIQKGWVTLVGAGRMSFAYPDFPRALAENGTLDPERVCVACSACTQIMRDGGRTGCVPRDASIYEPIYKAGRAEALDTILAEAKTCRQCNDPTCVTGCPARVNVPKFIGHIAAGRFREAYETIREQNVLAAVCGYVCPSEVQCEHACINQHYTEAVPIRHLQRWVSQKAVEEGWAAEPRPAGRVTGKRVAVLGAGPAGISAAAALASFGHKVSLFDSGEAPGGQARQTIPAERLPNGILTREVQDVLASSGVAEQRQCALGSSYTLDDVLAEGFDAVLIALGLSRSVPLPGSCRPASGVEGALEFLTRIKNGGTVTGQVLVLGGGNTAIDAALSAKRAGASDVFIVYRRSFAEMPAWPEERDAAIRAGVHFLVLTAPLAYVLDEKGNLTGLKVARTRLGEPDASGRRRPENIPGSEHVLPASLVVEAIGQQIDPELAAALPGVRVTSRGLIWTRDGTLETSRRGVFAAGDIVNGGTTVVQAVAEGARVAREIDEFLRCT
ncbi:MAG TPA: FAD-dependent oxidoreductase [Bryobacteraceae bacterium]|nr:FAD-dependent oxidoreductase [Bryobacteraceae bacterium]HOQ43716.1 FAD-dependent oxidoreductase [Bryobacteraceae bacterium]HPU71841.1 FAD-dependent oxidoreductase [Bryobacteraceae bacterium]